MNERHCPICDAVIIRANNSTESSWIKKKFCSRECRNKGQPRRKENRPLYSTWRNMRGRCLYETHTSYADYGGRGISVCDRWLHSYESFVADVGERPSPEHSIDRIDNNGNYEPGNVRWATPAQQQLNKRSRNEISFDGLTMSLTEWSNKLGIDRRTIHTRLKRGWSVKEAFNVGAQR